MTVKERLTQFAKLKERSVRAFEIKAGLTVGYVNAIRVSIQPDKVQSIASHYPDLNTGWLLTGEGEMLKSDKSQKPEITPVPERVNDDAVYLVPLIPVSAQGGTLNDFTMSVKAFDCERIVSPIKGTDFAMIVAGDSMTPEYPSGTRVFIKRINEHAFIDWGKVYVLDTCNGSVIKRVFPSEQSDKVKCVSINPEYPPFEVSFTDIFGVYRVMLSMSVK